MLKHKPDDGNKGLNLQIIITPMLDMAFQLLAFFIMTYQPSSYEVGLDIQLLPPEQLAIKGGKPKPKTEPEASTDLPPVKDAVLVVIKAYVEGRDAGKNDEARKEAGKTQEGMPLEIYFKTPESPDLKKIATEADTIDRGWQNLLASLKEYRKTLPPPAPGETEASVTTIVKLMPDAALQQRFVLKAWDVSRGAGFKSVGFVPPPDLLDSGNPSFKKLAEKD